jgi:hypothetical protein
VVHRVVQGFTALKNTGDKPPSAGVRVLHNFPLATLRDFKR